MAQSVNVIPRTPRDLPLRPYMLECWISLHPFLKTPHAKKNVMVRALLHEETGEHQER